MSVDAPSFRRALGQFASGVTVVTTRDAAGHPLGLTVSAFCSVSLHPPLVLVCIDHRSDANAGHAGERPLRGQRARRGPGGRLAALRRAAGGPSSPGFAFLEGQHGLPLVPGALAHVECRVRSFHDEGDHAVWVGEVLALVRPPRAAAPLPRRGATGASRRARRSGKPGGDRV